MNAIVWSWNEEPPAIYGRFDLAYDGIHPPKLLEYNADTPTALLEASVVQWYWLQDVFPKDDQFNSIHEHLVAKWKELKDYVGRGSSMANRAAWESASPTARSPDNRSRFVPHMFR